MLYAPWMPADTVLSIINLAASWFSPSLLLTCVLRAAHAAHSALSGIMHSGSYQSGAYAVDIVPALTGDLAFSNALELADGAPGEQGGAPYTHRR